MRRGHLNFYDGVLHWMFRLPRPVVFVNCFFIVCVYCNSFTDDRFVMKQMSKQELQCFLEFAPHYFRYVNKALDEQVCDQWPDVITNAKPIPQIPTHSHPNPFVLICNLLLRNSLFVGRKNLLSLLSNFLEVMGSFVEKRHGLMPNLMEMLLKNFLQTCVQWGIQGRGLGVRPLIFWPNWGPKGGKRFFGDRPPPPLYLRVWMTGLHRCPKDVRETY